MDFEVANPLIRPPVYRISLSPTKMLLCSRIHTRLFHQSQIHQLLRDHALTIGMALTTALDSAISA